MNLTIYKFLGNKTYETVGSAETTGISGSSQVTVPQVSGNVTFFASVYQDDVFLASSWVDFEEDAEAYFGTEMALFLAFLIVLCIGLMAVSEGGVTIVWVVLGLVFTSFMGLTSLKSGTGLGIVSYLMLAGGILLWKLNGGRNK